MASSIFSKMPAQHAAENGIGGILQLLRGGNPEVMARQMMESNQKFRDFVNQVKASGMTPDAYARQMGIDLSRFR